MIRIFSADQLKAWDTHTLASRSMASIELMEKACRAFSDWFIQNFTGRHRIVVVCGSGNNGGDGLGIARLLKEHGYPVRVVLQPGPHESLDFKINQQRLPAGITVTQGLDEEAFDKCTVIIDALYGTGLTRPLSGPDAQLIDYINTLEVIRVAVDVPSGLRADVPSAGTICRADYTVTFQSPKLAFFFPDCSRYVGHWVAVDIGLDEAFRRETPTPHYLLAPKAIRKLLKSRHRFDHKGRYGHALLLAGSKGRAGAAVLAARAAFRAGAGLVTVYTPEANRVILQTAVPEAMTLSDDRADILTQLPDILPFSAIGMGPGMGQAPPTAAVVQSALQYKKPLILDADALNIVAARPEWIAQIPPDSLLTPHPKEFERLVGSWRHDFDRLDKLKQLARDTRSIVILKGAWSTVATPEGNVYFNPTGNPGMATAGSGDVLAGILTGLRAQGYSPLETALIGVFLHGEAGDGAAREMGMDALMASDLIQALGGAWKRIR